MSIGNAPIIFSEFRGWVNFCLYCQVFKINWSEKLMDYWWQKGTSFDSKMQHLTRSMEASPNIPFAKKKSQMLSFGVGEVAGWDLQLCQVKLNCKCCFLARTYHLQWAQEQVSRIQNSQSVYLCKVIGLNFLDTITC